MEDDKEYNLKTKKLMLLKILGIPASSKICLLSIFGWEYHQELHNNKNFNFRNNNRLNQWGGGDVDDLMPL